MKKPTNQCLTAQIVLLKELNADLMFKNTKNKQILAYSVMEITFSLVLVNIKYKLFN